MPVIDVIRIFGNANFIGNVVEVRSVYVFQFHSWEAILRIFIIHMQPRMRRIIDTQVIELKVNFHTTNEKKREPLSVTIEPPSSFLFRKKKKRQI